MVLIGLGAAALGYAIGRLFSGAGAVVPQGLDLTQNLLDSLFRIILNWSKASSAIWTDVVQSIKLHVQPVRVYLHTIPGKNLI